MSERYMARLYKEPCLSMEKEKELIANLEAVLPGLIKIRSELIYNIESLARLSLDDLKMIEWAIRNKEDVDLTRSSLASSGNSIEVGPLLNFQTPDSANAVTACHTVGLKGVQRIEKTRKYQFVTKDSTEFNQETIDAILPYVHDEMTECHYPTPPKTFIKDIKPEPSKVIPVLTGGIEALKQANEYLGTGLDDYDLGYIYHLYVDLTKRNPTEDEWLDFGNSFSEHSRHHRFKAKLIIDDEEMPFTLFNLVKQTLKNTDNSIIAFDDDSSAIRGAPVKLLIPNKPNMPSIYRQCEILYHYTLTCETHNHPCLFEADAGAGTGIGGRRRDNKGVGRGGIVCAGSSGYLGGGLYIDDYPLPWEEPDFRYNEHMETPLSFFAKAPYGGFRDGNEFGEPVIHGFAESWGIRLAANVQGNIQAERLEYYKPIMFTGGFGFLNDAHKEKLQINIGDLIVRAGGSAYNIGMSGGSASSMMGGENKKELDRSSVQRADGEMSRKVYDFLRAMINMGVRTLIKDISDQGAGGLMNVFKELVDPLGANLKVREVSLGDSSLPTKAILVAEYQESMLFVIDPKDAVLVQEIADREKCNIDFIGAITGDNKVVVIDEKHNTKPIQFELKHLFTEYPQKTFSDHRRRIITKPLEVPNDITLRQGCELVFRSMAVGSKEWLMFMDRAVTGQVVQQQMVGPLSLPLSNYSLITPGFFDHTGQANAVALRPGIGLVSPVACAEITAAEILLKLMGVPITDRKDIKLSVNWMLPAKLPGGMAWLYDAALALKNILATLEMDIDGGKDSLSLATMARRHDGLEDLVRSLNTLVLTAYVGCTDFTKRLTPDIKAPGRSKLMFIDFAEGKTYLGGSVFAQVLKQIGDHAPNNNPCHLVKTFDAFQNKTLPQDAVLSMHKKSKGGLITTLCEMGFAGNCGFKASAIDEKSSAIEFFFNEAPGVVIEYMPEREEEIKSALCTTGVSSYLKVLGQTTRDRQAKIIYNGSLVLSEDMRELLGIWRETSFQLKKLNAVKSVVEEEQRTTANRIGPSYKLSFDPDRKATVCLDYPGKPRVAIFRDEGSNSNQEMAAAFYLAGFEPVDVHMTDLLNNRIKLDYFQLLASIGGFTYKDSLGSGAAMAMTARFNPKVREQLVAFARNTGKFIFGSCNGCQWMNRLGLIYEDIPESEQPRIVANKSECFESRFSTVRIYPSNSIFLRGMEGSVLGVHTANGEGRYMALSKPIFNQLLTENRMPIRFVDDYGNATLDYPFNPNNSKNGVCAVIDKNGRHLEWMLHPERTVLKHQWHWWPGEWSDIKNSPWLRFFQNAFDAVKKSNT